MDWYDDIQIEELENFDSVCEDLEDLIIEQERVQYERIPQL